MIRAIIFDCFGVLAGDGWLLFKQRYFGNRPDLLEQATDLNKQTDAGLLPYKDFVRQIAQLAGVSESDFRSQIEGTVVNDELMAYIAAELKPHYKIGMLSNVAGHWLKRKFSDKERQLFDVITLSVDTGFIKPDPRAYQAVLQQLGVEPQEAVFVDDRGGNCRAAQDIGMQAIEFESLEQFKTDLQRLL